MKGEHMEKSLAFPWAAEAPPDVLVVRPSTYNSWVLCSHRVLLSDQDGYDDSSSEAMAWGTGLHKLTSNRLIFGELADEMAATPEAVLGVWAAEMRERGEDLLSYANRHFLLRLSAEMLDAHRLWVERWWDTTGHRLPIVAVEETRYRHLGEAGDRSVWVQGTADLVTDGKVWDWKSAGRGWKRGKAESNIQHLIYSWLVEDLTDVSEAAYVVYDRTKGEWTWDETTLPVTASAIGAAVQAMTDMAHAIEAGVGVATPTTRGGFGDGRGWHCKPKYCGAWNICPAKSLVEDGLATEVRETPMRWEDK